MTHTPEPWHYGLGAWDDWTESHETPRTHSIVFSSDHGTGIWLSSNDYARAMSCVNACAGMSDPAAEIERLRAENERLKKENAAWKAFVDRVEGFSNGCGCCSDTTVEREFYADIELQSCLTPPPKEPPRA